jgi:hypothetical protein
LNGKEGVIGSSPMEGFTRNPATAGILDGSGAHVHDGARGTDTFRTQEPRETLIDGRGGLENLSTPASAVAESRSMAAGTVALEAMTDVDALEPGPSPP